MLGKVVKSVFGTRNQRMVVKKRKIVKQINDFESTFRTLNDAELTAKTTEFRDRLAHGEALEALLPEAFATVREASRRVLNMRHFDVQLIGAMVLNDGRIAEMRTGEGKTLVATLTAYLNALPGKGVHVVTVNDYLARRDSAWMGRLYNFLGLSVGVIVNGLTQDERRTAYAADITYGTNNEYGFDYLRDNMAFSRDAQVQRGQHYAIVDEVDSILIDEARTPLIISGHTEDRSDLYVRVNGLMPLLRRQATEQGSGGDYTVDEKTKQAFLTEEGHEHVERLMVEEGLIGTGESLYDATNIRLMHYITACLRAHALYALDVDYIVRDGQVVIVDEFTGRTMPGRRWSEGLHQAIEAKEGVPVQNENQTLASITFQNYFRLYKKLSGMTGTADTEAYEFQQIYDLEVVVIPTHRPMVRKDHGDVIFLTAQEKYLAVVEDIKACYTCGQPVLVGTASIEASELLASLLRREQIPHEVLNAKQHEREAHIIAQAGRPRAVTIATNMAGRGTDIVLGGNPEEELARVTEADSALIESLQAEWQHRHGEVVAAGGLHVIGSERHESRRIDNQLRGRAGRQGDPGSSRFYLSFEDNLMRIFAPQRVVTLLQRMGMQPGEAIEHPMVTRSIEDAQRKVEGHNFDIRKQLLEYDNVANDQRRVIYEQRETLLDTNDISEIITVIRQDVVDRLVDQYLPPASFAEMWDVAGLEEALDREFGLTLSVRDKLDEDEAMTDQEVRHFITMALTDVHDSKEHQIGTALMRQLEKDLMLQTLDHQWKEHLSAMDYLRGGIYLRGYAQRDPKQEYRREAFKLFESMLESVKHDVIATLARIQVHQDNAAEEIRELEEHLRVPQEIELQHREVTAFTPEEVFAEETPDASPAAAGTFVRDARKVGRNELCPCGSGKKFKHCHGRLA